MGKSKGIRLKIGFTKRDGKKSEFWATGPNNWDRMGEGDRDAWVSRAANKHHGGATEATILDRG